MVRLKVVTWNIRLGLEIDRAIEELQEIDEIASADVLLLQEMDEAGTAAIAEALGANYAYTTRRPHAQTSRDFGNAILSPWPMSEDAEVRLPHVGSISGHPRSATRTIIHVDDREFLVYSAHTEIASLLLSKRIEQFQAIANDIAQQRTSTTDNTTGVIVGGDFNTITRRGVRALTQAFGAIGLQHASTDAGPSFSRVGVKVPLDHIFANGLRTVASSVAWEAEASDHKPMWVELRESVGHD